MPSICFVVSEIHLSLFSFIAFAKLNGLDDLSVLHYLQVVCSNIISTNIKTYKTFAITNH